MILLGFTLSYLKMTEFWGRCLSLGDFLPIFGDVIWIIVVLFGFTLNYLKKTEFWDRCLGVGDFLPIFGDVIWINGDFT